MLDLDLIFAILHHLAVFTLVGIMAAEFALLRPGLAGPRLALLGRIDRAYGMVAMLVVVAGFLRVYFGVSGSAYYFGNWVFWCKLGAFVLVGLLSVPGTLAIARWTKQIKALPAFEPDGKSLGIARNFLHAQLGVLVFIPIFAAAMARGYGA